MKISLPSRIDPEIAPRQGAAFLALLSAVKQSKTLTVEDARTIVTSTGLAVATADSILMSATFAGILIPHRKQIGGRSTILYYHLSPYFEYYEENHRD